MDPAVNVAVNSITRADEVTGQTEGLVGYTSTSTVEFAIVGTNFQTGTVDNLAASDFVVEGGTATLTVTDATTATLTVAVNTTGIPTTGIAVTAAVNESSTATKVVTDGTSANTVESYNVRQETEATIVNQTPESEATDVAINATLTVEYSEAVYGAPQFGGLTPTMNVT